MAKKNITRFNIMVATCEDIDSQQIDKVIIDAINNWNYVNRDSDYYLMPDHWKKSVAPTSGDSPQAIIDNIITNTDDALVVCLWTKCGNGVDREIQNYIDNGKPVLLYIYNGDIPSNIARLMTDNNSLKHIINKYQNKLLYNSNIFDKREFKSELLLGLNQCIDKLKHINNKAINNDLKKEFSFNENEEFTVIDHAYSQYERDNLNIINRNRTFIWEIPKEFKKELIKKKFIQDMNSASEYDRPYSKIKNSDIEIKQKLVTFLNKYFNSINIESFLSDIANKTANFFLNKEGTNNFNGTALGIYNINRTRTIADELPIIDIELYVSDYFTFKFMSILYAELRKINHEVFRISSFDDINKLVPFFNSIGIGGFVCFNRGENVEFLFAKRGLNVSCPGQWHFTYDETFSLIDQSFIGGVFEFDHKRCLLRALKEEVMGNDENVDKLLKNSKYGFTDIGVITTDDRIEFELCGYVYFTFNEKFKYEDLKEKYKIAPDANWETSTMLPVNISEIEDFIKSNPMTPECKVLIKRLKYRVNAGKIAY